MCERPTPRQPLGLHSADYSWEEAARRAIDIDSHSSLMPRHRRSRIWARTPVPHSYLIGRTPVSRSDGWSDALRIQIVESICESRRHLRLEKRNRVRSQVVIAIRR